MGTHKADVPETRDRWLSLILLLALGLRTYHLAYPPWDYHNWRQTNTLMVARDFSRHGFNLLYPRVAWVSGIDPSRPSYFSGEFSVESILAGSLYRVFGESDAVARVVVISFSLAGIAFLYFLLRRWGSAPAARFGAFVYAMAPYSLFFGRVFMPDVPALSLALGGLNGLDHWTDDRRPTRLLAAAGLMALALLQKLSMVTVALPALFLFWLAFRRRWVIRWEPYAFAIVAGLPPLAWYWHSAQLAHLSGFSIMPTGNVGHHLARWLEAAFVKEALLRLTHEALSPTGLILFFLGALGLARGRAGWIFRLWFLASAGFLLLIPDTLSENYTDLLLLVPAGAALAGLALARIAEIPRLRPVAALLVLLFMADALRCALPLYRRDSSPHALGLVLNRLTAPSDLVATAAGGNPNVLYAADRRGWIEHRYDLPLLESLARAGARYYADTRTPVGATEGALMEALDERFYHLTPIDSPWLVYSLDERPGVQSEIPPEEIQNPYPVNFNHQIQMLGTSQRELLEWPTSSEITYYWQCLKKLERNLRVFVHVTTSEGQTVYQQDHWLLSGHFATTEWKAGDVVRERYVLTLPGGLQPGRYQLRVGWFDPEKGDRLPIVSPGASDGEARARVAEVEVHRAPRYRWFSIEE